MMSFERIVERIATTSNLSMDEIVQRVKETQEKYELLTPEGAARIVAKELGIDLEPAEVVVRPLRIEDLAPGMSRVDLVARIVRIHPPREFQYSSGKVGKRGGLLLRDRTGFIRLTLWDKQVEILDEDHVRKGDVIRVKNGYVVRGIDGQSELRLGARGNLEPNPADPRVDDLPPFLEGPVKISELKPELREADVVGRVAGISEVRVFERPGGGVGRVSTLTLNDGTGEVRVSLWDEWAEATKELRLGDPVKLENATVKEGFRGGVELSLTSRGRLIRKPPEGEGLPELPSRVLKIKEIEPGMSSIDLVAKVRRKLPPLEFRGSDGSLVRVQSLILADETGTIRLSLWRDAAAVAERLQPGDVVVVKNAYSKLGLREVPELHAGRNTEVEVAPPETSVGELRPTPVKLGEVEPGKECLEVIGRVLEVSPLREFTKPDGFTGRVASLVIADETGSVRASLWHEKAGLVLGVKPGDVVRLVDVHSSPGLYGLPELHLDAGGEMEINPPGVSLPSAEELKSKVAEVPRVEICEISREGERVEVRGTIVHIFQRRPIFEVCPNCGRGVLGAEREVTCEGCGKSVLPEHRAILSFLCDDGTANIRVTLFGKTAESTFGMSAGEIFERLKRDPDPAKLYEEVGLLGKEVTVKGVAKLDRLTELLELRGFEVGIPNALDEAKRLLEEVRSSGAEGD
jgi:replication factor A1